MAIPTIPDLRDLMEAGVHFGHASGRWHPKMRPYIFATRDKLHIINLEKVQEQLKEVLPILEERIREGKIVVLVGTKRQVSDHVKRIGEANGIPYVNVRWLGGTMTNFSEVQKSFARLKNLEEFILTEDYNKMIKKERVALDAELARMQAKFGGLKELKRKPDALFIIDPKTEHNAVKEAKNEGTEIFAVVDTDTDPSVADFVIPANDDGPKSVALIMDLIEKTIESGKKLFDLKREAKAKEDAEAKEAKEVEEAKEKSRLAEEMQELEEEKEDTEVKKVARKSVEDEKEKDQEEEKKDSKKK